MPYNPDRAVHLDRSHAPELNVTVEASPGLPAATCKDEHQSMTLEELLTAKERLEDLIAEREMAAGPAPAPAKGATAKAR